MAIIRTSPNVCAFPDDEHEELNIEIELPGVEKKDINFKIHEDSFYVRANKKDLEYAGAYAICCPVKPDKAKAKYSNGILKVTVPYKQPMDDAVEVTIE